MTEENIMALVMVAVRNAVPAHTKVFNFSIDFVAPVPETVVPVVKVLHQGRKTIVLDVSVNDMQEQMVAKALVTLVNE